MNQQESDDDVSDIVESDEEKEQFLKAKVGGKYYYYKGPQDQQIKDLFDILKQKQNSQSYFKIIKIIRNKVEQLENYFEKKCRIRRNYKYLQFDFTITLYDFLVSLVFLVMYGLFLAKWITLFQDDKVTTDDVKNYIANNFTVYGAIFTIYGMLIIHQSSRVLNMILFLSLFVTQVTIFYFIARAGLFENKSGQVIFETIFIFSMPVFLFLHWFIVGGVYRYVKEKFGEQKSCLCQSIYCFTVPYYLFTNVMTYLFLTDDKNSYTIVNSIISILAIPVSVLFLASWSILHYKMFALPINAIQQAIIGIKQDLLGGFKKSKEVDDHEGTCLKFLKKHVGTITSILMGTIYLGCEYYLIIQLVTQFKNENIDPETTTVLVFEIIAVPIYVCLGIYIGATSRKQADNFLFIPLFLIGLPLLFLYPLSQYLLSVESTKIIADLVLFGPPCTCLVWLILSILGIKKRLPFLFSSTYVCVFFAFPIGFLYPLSRISSFASTTKTSLTSLFSLLLGIGVGLIFLYMVFILLKAIYHQFKNRKKKEDTDKDQHQRHKNREFFIDIKKLAVWNFQNYGFMANASGFLFGYGLLVWLIYNYPKDITPDEKGYVLGMLIVFPIMFILLNYTLRSRSLQLKNEEGDEDDDDANALPLDQDFDELEEQEYQNKKRGQKIQKIAANVGIILPILLFLPLAILVGEQYLRTMFIVIMSGIPISFCVYKLFTFIKNSNQEYQNFLTPCLVGICWTIFIIPFAILLPVYTSLVNNLTISYGNFMRVIVGSTVIFFMIGITTLTMFVHIYFNQIEREREKKYIVDQLFKVIAEHSYRSDNLTMSRLVIKYWSSNKSFKKLSQRLIKSKEPVTRVEDTSKNETKFRIVTDKIANKLNKKGKKKKTNKGWMTDCLDIFCCRIGMEDSDVDSDDDDPTKKKNKDITKELFDGNVMDGYFPKDFQQKMLRANEANFLGITAQIEKAPEERMMERFIQSNQGEKKDREDITSSLTYKFREMQSDDPNNIAQQEFKYTTHGMELQDNEKYRIEFFHDIWEEFSNKDDNFPSCVIYNDWLELMRLSNIHDPNSIDTSFLDKLTVVRIYDQNAQVPWKNGLLVLDLKAFSVCLKNLAREIFPDEENLATSMKSLCVEVFYLNLLHNLKNFAINYRTSARQKIKRSYKKEQELKDSPFNVRPDEEQDAQEEIKRIDIMIDPDLPVNTANDVDRTQNDQENILIGEFGRKIQLEPKKEKKKKPLGKRCLYGFCRCMRKCYCTWPAALYLWITTKIEDKLKSWFGSNKQKRKYQVVKKGVKKDASAWEVVVQAMLETIIKAEYDYAEMLKQKQGMTYQLKQWDISNLMALQNKFGDLYSIGLIAFSNNVSWYPGMSPTTEEDTAKYAVTDGSIINEFWVAYVASLVGSILYAILTKVAQPYMIKESLGQDKDGNKAGFPHPQFFLTKSLQLLGGSGFMMIMRSLLDSFICVWQGDGPWYLYRDSEIQCLSNQHMLMMIGAIVGLTFYYPISTYLFPTFQFQDKGLEIKYDPVFMVAYVQAKLLILGVTSFFKSFGQDQHPEINRHFQLGIAAMCMFLIAALNIKIKPCLINWVNLMESCLYLLVGTLNGGAFLISYTGQPILGPVVVFPLLFIIIVFSIYKYRKDFRNTNTRKKNQIDQDLPQIKVTERYENAEGLPIYNKNNLNDDDDSQKNLIQNSKRKQFDLNKK